MEGLMEATVLCRVKGLVCLVRNGGMGSNTIDRDCIAIFYLLKGDYRPLTLNGSFHLLFHYPIVALIFYLLKGD